MQQTDDALHMYSPYYNIVASIHATKYVYMTSHNLLNMPREYYFLQTFQSLTSLILNFLSLTTQNVEK